MKTIHILATGNSVKCYKPTNEITIGVNDVNKYFNTDYLLLLDKPHGFAPARLDIILKTTARYILFTHPGWVKLFAERPGKILHEIRLREKGGDVSNLDNVNELIKHVDSPFTAVHIAYSILKREPAESEKQIIMYGVDFINHYLAEIYKLEIISAYRDLYKSLKEKGVQLFTVNNKTILSGVIPHLTTEK